MRYLLLSVLVVCIVGILMIPSAFAQSSLNSLFPEEKKLEFGDFEVVSIVPYTIDESGFVIGAQQEGIYHSLPTLRTTITILEFEKPYQASSYGINSHGILRSGNHDLKTNFPARCGLESSDIADFARYQAGSDPELYRSTVIYVCDMANYAFELTISWTTPKSPSPSDLEEFVEIIAEKIIAKKIQVGETDMFEVTPGGDRINSIYTHKIDRVRMVEGNNSYLILADMTIHNINSYPMQLHISSTQIALLDFMGRGFSMITSDDFQVFGTIKRANFNWNEKCPHLNVTIQPDVSKQVRLCYEVPKDSDHFRMIGYSINNGNTFGFFDKDDVIMPSSTQTKTPTPAPTPAPEPEISGTSTTVLNAVGSSTPGCEETDRCFIPSTVKIDAGTTVTWKNPDSTHHTITSGTLVGGVDGKFDSGLIFPGNSFSYKFNAAGTYDYICMVHPWMQGIVIVEPKPQPTPTPTPTPAPTPAPTVTTTSDSSFKKYVNNKNKFSIEYPSDWDLTEGHPSLAEFVDKYEWRTVFQVWWIEDDTLGNRSDSKVLQGMEKSQREMCRDETFTEGTRKCSDFKAVDSDVFYTNDNRKVYFVKTNFTMEFKDYLPGQEHSMIKTYGAIFDGKGSFALTAESYEYVFDDHFDKTMHMIKSFSLPSTASAAEQTQQQIQQTTTSESGSKSIILTEKLPSEYVRDYVLNYKFFRDWFERNYPNYTIYGATGISEQEYQMIVDDLCSSKWYSACAELSNIKPDSAETTSQSKGGGCLIATAAFGSEMAPQVQFLREIRDNTVLQTESGTSFMAGFNQFYYSFSPAVADYERENPAFKEAVKITLTPLLASLTLLQYADIDSESEMLGYGIGVILLNIGMYFVAPAVLLSVCIRKISKN